MQNEIKTIWIDLHEELFNFILSKIKDPQIAKDIHHDVFLKVQSKLHQLKHTSKLTSWVYQITRHTILDYYRSQKKNNISIDTIEIAETDTENFHYSKLSTCINQKINALSSQHKEAIILTSFKNYSQKELADHLKISYSGTKSRVQKARNILKENLLDCPNLESDNSGNIIDFEN